MTFTVASVKAPLTQTLGLGGNLEAKIVIDNLSGSATITITKPDGRSLTVPSRYLAALGKQSHISRLEIVGDVMGLRQEFIHSVSETPLTVRGEGTIAASIAVEGDGNAMEGTPTLSWKMVDDKFGWQLALAGAIGTPLGFAAWNDTAALGNLLEAMGDPETLFTFGGMMDPTQIALLSARMSAGALRAARQLPGITIPKVRTILETAELTSLNPAVDTYNCGRARVLTICNNGRNIPVAIALLAPRLTRKDPAWGSLSRIEAVAAVQAAQEANRVQWNAKAATALTAGGWRVVDLQTRGDSILWVTRISTEMWSSLYAAINLSVAGGIYMNSGGRI